jgi:hypothetical protein
VQAKLQQLGSLGATPKDIAAVALGALINWQVKAGASTPFMPAHLTAAIQQYVTSRDGRVSVVQCGAWCSQDGGIGLVRCLCETLAIRSD